MADADAFMTHRSAQSRRLALRSNRSARKSATGAASDIRRRGTVPTVAFFAMAALLLVAAPCLPCSVVGPLPSAQELVNRAEVIVRARVEGLSDEPGRGGTLAGSPSQVRFTVLVVLKGSLRHSVLEFNGHLDDRDDPNDRVVPYDFVRPGGRHGNCF